jgi:transcriptional repressor NrdR
MRKIRQDMGFLCPLCGNRTRVIDVDNLEDGDRIRRRRECPRCKNRITTSERIVPASNLDAAARD